MGAPWHEMTVWSLVSRPIGDKRLAHRASKRQEAELKLSKAVQKEL